MLGIGTPRRRWGDEERAAQYLPEVRELREDLGLLNQALSN